MKRIVTVALLLSGLAAALAPARATCSSGFSMYLAGQVPEIHFTAGVPQTISFKPWYVSFSSSSGSCGVFAKSTTAGVGIRDSYGCPGTGCTLEPTGTWAPVGSAYDIASLTVSQKAEDIPIVYDGTSPAGTYGTVQIGLRDNDLGIDSEGIIGVMNVYIDSATPTPTWFGVGTSASNVSGDHVVIDHPYLNNNYNAKLFVSHVRNPGGTNSGTSWNHPISVVYDSGLERWTIHNADGVAMPTGLGFGLRVDPTAITVCTSSFPGTYTYVNIDHPLSNNSVWATVLVTPIGGGAHPVAVTFVSPNWHIVYQDGANIPPGTCFNVQAYAFSHYLDDPASGDYSSRTGIAADWGVGEDIGGDGSGHSSAGTRTLEFDWALGNPSRPVITTYNLSPLGWTASFDSKYFGVTAPLANVFGRRWGVYEEDGSTMPLGDRFNVWTSCAADAWYPDADGDGYGASGPVVASCAPPAGYANRAGDCDDTNATKYPGSVEINDGLDNTCPGVDGAGLVDELSGLAWFDDATTLCWFTQAGATLYDIARSAQRNFSSCSLIGTSSTACFQDATVPTAGHINYYLVRPSSPHVGSWGMGAFGNERLLTCQ